jgi:phenylacetate-CoA ligase
MFGKGFRKRLYFIIYRLRGQPVGTYYQQILSEWQAGIPVDTTRSRLIRLFLHCKQSVPYYAKIMRSMGDGFLDDPEEYLRYFPILTKRTIRSHFDELKSADLSQRKWNFNSTGGSTGEPVRFIQDKEQATQAGAISMLYSKLVGKEIGDSEVLLWGSIRDITRTTASLSARLATKLANTTVLSVFRLDPSNMREYISFLDTRRPRLIVAYPLALYELARFAEREGLEVSPQAAIIVSGATLYPFMRETIERIFQCKVFNRYGSRELGDIACERPGFNGLWVAPWGNYVEIVDGEGHRVPDGTKGEILVTSLSNFAMPFIRYRIEDRGIMSPPGGSKGEWFGQVLESVLGRSYDMFINKNGTLVEGGHFMALLWSRDWISKYQVIQESNSHILFKIVKAGIEPQPAELEEISSGTRSIMHDDVEVTFEFVDEIVPPASGKHRFIISKIQS